MPTLKHVPEGSRVDTPYGKGVIRSFRPEDDIFAVALSDWNLADGNDVMAYLTKDYINPVVQSLENEPALTLATKGDTTERKVTAPGSGGIFQLFRYGFTTPGTGIVEIVVPYADEVGVKRQIDTVFGLAETTMKQPYNGCLKATLVNPDFSGAVAYIQVSQTKEIPIASTR
ncbi:Hypothetical protein PHPALM_5528, partial [Phytophthora palmivora]